MSPALRFERFAAEPSSLEPFERVRSAVGLYRDAEAVPHGTPCLLAWRGDEPVARCTLLEAGDLKEAPGVTGLIGHYETVEREAGVALLESAARALAERGVRRVLGPMNGNTWARYRLALAPEPDEGAPAPPFLLEPWNPFAYADDFVAAGFAIAARYESRAGAAENPEAADAESRAAALGAAGIRVRPIDTGRFDQDLRLLYELSLAAFADNLYYSPLPFEPFRASYERMRPLIDPELVLVAEGPLGEALGFQFAYVDPLSPGGEPPRAIVKTVVTAPAARGRGLGGHLLDRLRRRARALGCGSVIHALMHVSNFSMRMSARHETRLFRRYALYEWRP